MILLYLLLVVLLDWHSLFVRPVWPPGRGRLGDKLTSLGAFVDFLGPVTLFVLFGHGDVVICLDKFCYLEKRDRVIDDPSPFTQSLPIRSQSAFGKCRDPLDTSRYFKLCVTSVID